MALAELLDGEQGHPSAMHRYGQGSRAAIEQARRQVATAMGVEASHVVFTSGGTESDNLAVIGAALAARHRDGPFRVAVSAVEHKAILQAAGAVETLCSRRVWMSPSWRSRGSRASVRFGSSGFGRCS